MMKTVAHYELNEGIATITLDDGKKNAVTPALLKNLNHCLDQAEKDKAIVVLTGVNGVLSAGFDLNILKKGVADAYKMLIGGFELPHRMLSFPYPIVIACNGHAMAMGAFILLSGDHRIGCHGEFKIAANEVALGLTMPHTAIEVCKQRINPAYLSRTILLSEIFNPETALAAGFVDELADEKDLMSVATERAKHFQTLDLDAHRESKLRLRKSLLQDLKSAVARDRMEFVKLGVSRVLKR